MAKLINDIMHDGSRLFILIPQERDPIAVVWTILRLKGAWPTFVLPSLDQWWIDFRFRGHRFTINDQFGDYWFFAQDPNCPEVILQEVADYFSQRLSVSKR